MTEHVPGCPLRAAPWLDASGDPGAFVVRAAAGALSGALADLAQIDVVTDARLAAAIRHAAPDDDERRPIWCTCPRRGDS